MLRRVVRRVVPAAQRARLRFALNDLPFRAHDLPRDFLEAVRADGVPLPPARLRSRVGRNSSRDEFLETGGDCAEDVFRAFSEASAAGRKAGRWLDFGCGCGRVARHLLEKPEIAELEGVDTDARQVAWAQRHLPSRHLPGRYLPGRWLAISPEAPMPLPSRRYDVVFSVSVFTHLSASQETSWLSELRRVLVPGGLLIASTHSPRLAGDAFVLSSEDRRSLDETGFLHVTSAGPFNSQATFHSESYLRSVWSEQFSLRLFLPAGLVGYQDLSVWAR